MLAWVNSNRYATYGVTLLGEVSPLACGAFFALVSYLGMAYAGFDEYPERPSDWTSILPRWFRQSWCVLFGAFVLSSASIAVGIKLSIVFFAVGVLAFCLLSARIRRMALASVVGVGLAGLAFSAVAPFSVKRVFFWRSYVLGFTGDRIFVWEGLVPYVDLHPFTGIGRGGLHLAAGADALFGEAHNQYLPGAG